MGIPLGAFELGECLGKGGMAEVWKGVHLAQQTPVAVKVVTEPDVRRPALHASLRNEVRAMARLDHPGIVMVYDYGEITHQAEEASAGALIAGSPYLVMELADGGTAQELCGTLSWQRAKRVLVSLLEALAHAHARGVVHRDVKPSNALVFGTDVRLSDFGLAIDLEPHLGATRRGRVLGTPAYMAPEQFVGDWREYGPPTDLYSFGCVAYALVSGAPPFGRSMDVALMHELHQDAAIPPLDPRVVVPAGFDVWVQQLLAKRPSRRFQFAADALAALADLSDPEGSSSAPEAEERPPESALSSSIITMAAEVSERDPLSVRYGSSDSAPPPPPHAPLPASWSASSVDSSDAPRERSTERLGVGLGLFGVRPVPLVGRELERDRLWRELLAVADDGEKRLVLLTGPAGCGKSRLAQWLCERAHEAGAAAVLKAIHSPHPGPSHGIGPMLARYLRCEGLERHELRPHIERRMLRLGVRDREDSAALSELCAPHVEGDAESRVRFASAGERHVLAARLVRRISRIRPVIVWLDDVEHDVDAVGLAQQLMVSEAGAAVLLVLTRTLESEEEGQSLSLYPGASTLALGPLPEEEWSELAAGLLHLEPQLAAHLAARTRGNPLFAVQLCGHWVDRGLLEPSSEGFRLREGMNLELPEELQAVWRERIERVMRGRSQADEIGIEIAAILGEDVDVDEWRSACNVAGLIAPEALVEELIARRLASADAAGPRVGWSFVHDMLREALERRAAQAGRASAHHRACAHMLRARRGHGLSERLARHLIAAGDQRLALAPLRDAARERLDRGDYALGDKLLATREESLVELRCEEADVNWAEGWILRGELAFKRGQLEVGHKWASLAAQAAADHGWPLVRAAALGLRGRIARQRAELKESEVDLREAEGLCRDAGDEQLLAEVLQSLGRLLMHKGELEAAGRVLLESRDHYQKVGDNRGMADARWSLAHLESYHQRYDEALAHNEAALDALRQWGDRWGVARCLNTAGEIHRLVGRLDEAEHNYREARDLMRALGASDSAAVCESNVARVQAERGAYAEARVRLERSRPVFEQGRRDALAWLYLVLLLCDAGQRDWASWDQHWRVAEELLSETGYLDLDIAIVAEMAGTLARDAGDGARAAAAYELARKQWQGLGRGSDAERVARACP
jgi:serine/threonine protein kinase/tetratricopeptide (TPR) repeat protein